MEKRNRRISLNTDDARHMAEVGSGGGFKLLHTTQELEGVVVT